MTEEEKKEVSGVGDLFSEMSGVLRREAENLALVRRFAHEAVLMERLAVTMDEKIPSMVSNHVYSCSINSA